ncbi:Histone-lysine N-methyltransferase, H3 lysine-9 specific SUVH5 [Hibiscus syriacus]|uniref:Histone-lysine N-methyltransferase, H3 lysine-9 specific SUVH5 n=1 Tax=Hibiscus syriacus TaxID=106335 RepID=A0A6A3CES4_HIBSY|nr:Histone-lysine N-methyltransferase, H3 lysine-9 specific SUVH5 [Hibiscus syriacus]
MLHKVISKLASGGHSEARLGRVPSENGHIAPAPMFKKRNVSAVRDFPPGCGRLAAQITKPSEQEEEQTVSESEKPELLPNYADKVQCEKPAVLTPDNAEKKDLPEENTAISPRRGVTAVRDFPPFCGRNAPPLSEEERAKWLTSLKNKGFNIEKFVNKEKSLVKTLCADVRQVIEDVQDIHAVDGLYEAYSCNDMEEDAGNSIKPSCEAIPNEFDQNSVEGIDSKPEEPSSEKMEKQGAYEAYSCNDMEEDAGNMSINSSKPSSEAFPNEFDRNSEKVTETGDVYGTEEGQIVVYEEGNSFEKSFLIRLLLRINCWRGITGVEKFYQIVLVDNGKTPANLTWLVVVVWNKEDLLQQDEQYTNDNFAQRSCSYDVSLRLCPSSTDHDNDAMTTWNKVRETLCLFQVIYRKLLQEEESKMKEQGKASKRIDILAAKILKEKGKYVNTGKQIIGPVPGVEVGDEFQYFVELNIVGLHRQRGYANDLDSSDVLSYMGQGGNVMQKGKQPEDQKLERGNLALANSKVVKNPVRVIRGESRSSSTLLESRGKIYVYDGLYLVVEFKQESGPHGKLVFKYKLVRIPGQPELAWKVVKKSKVQEGLVVNDISQRKEKTSICAINTIDGENPPSFVYEPHMIYPDWCCPIPSKGCGCINGCSESVNCSCVMKNGGEIPYNHNGAIVEAKPLVYECGPNCSCPPSCHNRVGQHGMKFQLEIFKTESRGWGVRSLNSIPSGSFICEYAGELLEDREAERKGSDEYLFDIGNNSDISLWDGLSTIMPDAHSSSCQVVQDSGFTIDAARIGNIGRFINHSCSPNLYAQNVLYDHEDMRISHIMFFAAENIPPLQELTYHYNYMIDQVRDDNGT